MGHETMLDDRRRVTAVIRDYLARQRMSREQFAFKTRLGKSTVDKLLTGIFSEKTLSIVESHTGLSLRTMLERGPAPQEVPAPAGTRQTSLPSLGQPSIAVLPFTNLGGVSDQDYLADGISEDIITALARLRWLFVIARNSTFVYKGRAADVRQVSHELGVRYVLEGSVRTAGPRMRITAQLIDAETGNTTGTYRTSSPFRMTSPNGWWLRWSRTSTRRKGSAPPAGSRTALTPGGWSCGP
jgi:adenylate cyclase